MRLIFTPVWPDIIARKWPQKTLLSALTIAPQESADPLYTALKAPLEPVYDGRHAVHDSLRRNMHRFLALCLLVLSTNLYSQSNHTYTLAATPKTVAWGYYDAAAIPVLHIQSGDTVTGDTSSTVLSTSMEPNRATRSRSTSRRSSLRSHMHTTASAPAQDFSRRTSLTPARRSFHSTASAWSRASLRESSFPCIRSSAAWELLRLRHMDESAAHPRESTAPTWTIRSS